MYQLETKVSEYDQEIPKSQNADQPTTSWGRVTEDLQQQDILKTIKAKQPALSSSSSWLQNKKGQKVMHNKTKTNTDPLNQWEAHQTADQQQQNHHLRTDSSLSHRGLNAFYWYQIFALDSVVVKTQNY